MKKRNRLLAGLLAILLVLTSFTWPSGNTMVANADEGTNITKVTPYEKICFEFDDIDVKTLEEAGFTSTQFDKNASYAVKETADQAVSSHWFAGKTGTSASGGSLSSGNAGLKSQAKDSQKIATFLNTPYTYEDFHVKTEIYWGVNSGIVFGEKNVYPRSTTGYSAVNVYFANNRIQLGGALDYSTAKVTGRDKGWSTYQTTGIYYFADKFTATKNNVYTLNVRVQDDVLSVWVDGYATLLTVNLAKHYKAGSVALMNHKYDGDGGGFKSFEISDLNASGYTNFDNINVAKLEASGFTSTRFNKDDSYAVVGEKNQKVSEHWTSGNATISSGNTGLKSNATDKQRRATFLNTPYTYENFKISTEIYWGVNAGVIIGEKNEYPRNVADYGAISAYFANNRIQLGGALDFNTAKVTGEDAGNWSVYNTNTGFFVFDKSLSNKNPAKTNGVYDMNIQMLDGILTVWVDGYDAVLTVNVAKHYEAEAIALMHHKYDGDGGAFKSFAIVEIPREEVKAAQVGEGFSKEFTTEDFKVSDLNEEFSAYYFATADAIAKRREPSVSWDKAKSSSGAILGLKPKHNNASGSRTMLTYDPLSFRNVEVTTKYQINWTRYGVMIAPEGQFATAENGINVFVESTGTIKIMGAIDPGSAWATGGYIMADKNNSLVSSYPIPDYADKATNKFYNLHVKVDGDEVSVWMDEFEEFVITIKLTEAYQGGMVSLYSHGNNSGGLGTFTATEIEPTETETNVYTQSFSALDSLDELKDFTAYFSENVQSETKQVNIQDVFRLDKGRLQAINAENGKDDRTNHAILTLNTKEYKNFELTLHYEQSRMQRYGIMFGQKLGEFVYTQENGRLVSDGGVYVYTEAEGYRDIRGAMYASSYTKSSQLLHRANTKIDSFWWHNNDVMNNVQKKTLHTMTIRVVDEYMTMVVDHDEDSRVTVRLADYNGGHISLVSDSAVNEYGGFTYLKVTELSEEAGLGVALPGISDGFETMQQVDDMFDAYYLKDAKESSKLEKVDVKKHWWLNDRGFLSRTTSSKSDYSVVNDVEVLTYTKQKFTDFEMTYTYEQNYNRLGVLIGGDLGEYPISYVDGKITVDKGALVFIEAEGYVNVKGHLNNMTKKDELLYRVTKPSPEGFKDANGKVDANLGKPHTVKIVVKDKQLYVFLDGAKEAAAYVYLGDNYKGGYVSLFAHATKFYGFNDFTITDKITTTLPAGGGTSVSGNTFIADFNSVKFDDSAFTTYYLAKTKGNADGSMEKQNFEDQWTIDNGVLEANNRITAPTSKTLTEFEYDDSTKAAVLTYNKKMTDFVVSYDFQKTPQRMMFMFGTEMGKFALAAPNTTQKGQGVLIYPENDLGISGGICALGNMDTYNSSMRPMARTKVTLEGYHIKGEWASNVGTWHTMTVAVVDNHCYIYLDDYGMIADYELRGYEGGYISLATTGRSAGFDNLKITDLSGMAADAIVSAEEPKDIVTTVGTDASALGLPQTVKATLKNGSKVDVPVTWIPLYYNAGEEGIYQFTAVAGGNNPANVGVRQYVKVYKQVPATRSGVKEWRFDTPQDLKDFKATYLKNAETGYITADIPNWYVSQSGILSRDPFRSVNGDQYKELAILTYKGEKYTNFELEVEYTQQWQRMMVMFGSEKVGAYIDLKDIYAETNPVAGFVEMEGTRNFIGNLINANFDSNDKEKINNARESGIRLENYYDKVLYGGNQGKKHTMKIRVVGDQASMWVDNCETPYTCTLTNYDGGYISLVSTVKGGTFDNLKITRLGPTPEVVIEENAVAANGTMHVSIDTSASTDLKLPKKVKPGSYEDFADAQEASGIPAAAYVLGGSTILLSTLIGAIILLLARKKNKNQEEIKG